MKTYNSVFFEVTKDEYTDFITHDLPHEICTPLKTLTLSSEYGIMYYKAAGFFRHNPMATCVAMRLFKADHTHYFISPNFYYEIWDRVCHEESPFDLIMVTEDNLGEVNILDAARELKKFKNERLRMENDVFFPLQRLQYVARHEYRCMGDIEKFHDDKPYTPEYLSNHLDHWDESPQLKTYTLPSNPHWTVTWDIGPIEDVSAIATTTSATLEWKEVPLETTTSTDDFNICDVNSLKQFSLPSSYSITYTTDSRPPPAKV